MHISVPCALSPRGPERYGIGQAIDEDMPLLLWLPLPGLMPVMEKELQLVAISSLVCFFTFTWCTRVPSVHAG